MIKIGEKELGKEINPVILFSLLDHLLFAFKRLKEDMIIRSPIEWEIKQFYSKEVAIGKKALELIETEKNIRLPETEAVFIAMHFINYQFDHESMELTMDYMEAMRDITQLVRYYFQVEIDENSINYQRFLNHLRYYLMRLNTQESMHSLDNDEIVLTVKNKYPKEFKCSLKISKYLEERYKKKASLDEQLYLTLHLTRLLYA
nr:PRD domain-containing protein [Enterococcus rivorum]